MGAIGVLYRRCVQQLSSVLKIKLTTTVLICGLSLSAFSQNPSASFTSNVFTGCAPLTVDFTNLSTQATNYIWSFGNGNTSTLKDPTTVYITSGFYTVTLIAVNSLTGGRDTLTATNYINVVDNPTADFTASPLSSCLNTNVISFTNMSMNANQYTYDFGDGTTSINPNPTHTYNNPGTYTVKLLAKNPWGCQDAEVKTGYITILPNPNGQFQATPRSTCDAFEVFSFNCSTSNVVSYEWDFGDGNTSALQNPTHVYGVTGVYSVSLILTGTNGCTDTIIEPGFINIGSSLVPSFTVDNKSGCPPLISNFDCTVSNAISWSWDFGDGNTSLLENPTNTYLNPGSYTVTLTVTTSTGCDGTVSLPAYIAVDNTPTAEFSFPSNTGCMPYDVLFSNNSTGGSTYSWNFGDGFNSNLFNPTHTYSDTGSYDVSLTVTSANGCISDTVITNAINVETLEASYTGKPRIGCPPLPVVLNGNSNPLSLTWEWDLGDGNTANTQSVNHVYNLIGNYDVKLIATSAAGCTDTLQKNNFFRVVDGTTSYTVPDTILVCTPPGTVTFADPTFGADYWSWHFGDGDSSNINNPTHTYLVPGVYTVTLTTSIPGGCVQVYNPYAIIEVMPFDVSPIQSIILNNCQPYQVQFSDTTSGVSSYLWDFGDGNTSTLATPIHTYSQPGTYTVSLQIISNNGCLSSLTTTVTLGHTNPITVSSDENCTGDSVQFGISSSAFISAIWDFGDGNSSTDLTPVHIYNVVGDFNVSVILTDSTACVDTFYFSPIHIGNPQPSFIVPGPTEGCVTLQVSFVNTSTGASSYYWEYGTGNPNNAVNPTKSYGTPGVYSVTLTATDNGCSRSVTQVDLITAYGATAAFSFTQTNDCFPITIDLTDKSIAPVSWLWDFGDGNTSSQQNPSHTFNLPPTGPISLTIVDTNGCSKTKTKPNITFVMPEIVASDTSGCRPHSVNFSSSTTATDYLWDFGDGNVATGSNVMHLFTDTGHFDITLSCVLASGCTTTVTLQEYIEVTAPIADFNSLVLAACAPTVVNFNNLSSPGSVSYLWDFGDGSTSTSDTPSNLYTSAGAYAITLIATDTLGCSDTIIKPDYILIPGPSSQFTFASQIFCLQTFVQFTDLSTNATNWAWNFGDGYTSTQQNPAHTYQDTGSYVVSLITTDSVGCTSLYVSPNPVVVYPDPDAQGGVSVSSGCHPLTVDFINNSIGATGYTWYFGNGDSSNAASPTYTYTTPGNYQVYLVAVNQFGCHDTFFVNDSIEVYMQPVADFNPSVFDGCEPLFVNFVDNSQFNTNASYSWNFGNGSTSTLLDPSTIFNQAGVYSVQMTLVNQGGCIDSISKEITVNESPVAAGMLSDYGGCSPHAIIFTDMSVGIVSWQWDFGDGTVSNIQNPTHTYTQQGTYIVQLIVESMNGCTDTLDFANPVFISQSPAASINASTNLGCTPLGISFNNSSSNLINPSYSWDFGNGTVSTQDEPSVLYTNPGLYDVSMIVTNQSGCSDTANTQITVNLSALASAGVTTTEGCSPLTVSFNNNSTGAIGYQWDFGDGATSSDTLPVHIYSVPGYYSVNLIAQGVGGCSDTIVVYDSIYVKPSPEAIFSSSLSSNCSPVAVALLNSSNATINASYFWDFGNGTISNLATPTLTYNSGGTFNISLIVIDEGGCSDTATAVATIGQSPTALTAVIDTSACSGITLDFINQSINSDSYIWNYGDGNTSTNLNETYTYNTPGIYTPFLVAINNSGCNDTLNIGSVQVKEQPLASFSVDNTVVCFGEPFNFINNSTPINGVTFNWDVGGFVSNDINPQITLVNPGIYDVSLIATHQDGCSDTLVEPYFVKMLDSLPPPVSPIFSASVLNDYSVEITWQNSASLDLSEYRLYRFNQLTGIYDLIFVDSSPTNSSISVSSSYVDAGLNTLMNSYTYKLQTVDICNNARPLGASVPHSTINVTAQPLAGNIRVFWTPYQGCVIDTYEITRTDVNSGVSSLVATVLPHITAYTDTGFYCPDDYLYRIKATGLCGVGYESLSDTSGAIPANALSLQVVDIVKSTVLNDSEVLTEWLPPVISPQRVIGYEIYRSDGDNNYVYLTSVSALEYSYIDYNVDVHTFAYHYKIQVLNDCNLKGSFSNLGTSILLQSEGTDNGDKLWWTKYNNWNTGIDHYVIEVEDSNGNWNPVKKVDGNVNTIKIE